MEAVVGHYRQAGPWEEEETREPAQVGAQRCSLEEGPGKWERCRAALAAEASRTPLLLGVQGISGGLDLESWMLKLRDLMVCTGCLSLGSTPQLHCCTSQLLSLRHRWDGASSLSRAQVH